MAIVFLLLLLKDCKNRLFIICVFCLFTGVRYDVPHGMCVPYAPILLYTFRGVALLTMGSYRSVGTCMINHAPTETNIVIGARC